MDFEKFLPSEENKESSESEEIEIQEIEDPEKISPNQFYDIITDRKPDWQTIIYDLIHTNQLDPWDIDIILLTQKYFEKIQEIEEVEYYISSKVILAAALMLRIKSEFLLNKHIKSIDDILFGKKAETKYVPEKIEIDENELPILMPKTPLPRARRITLPELMSALNKAINTESRRIKREVSIKRAHKLSHVDIPQFRRIDLKDRIKQFYARILTTLKRKSTGPHKDLNKLGYSQLIGEEREEKLASFLPLLHLSNTKKLWLEQNNHLDEIWIYLYEYFKKNDDMFIEELEEDIEDMKEELANSEAIDLNASKITGLEKARLKREEKKKLEEQIREELKNELGGEFGKGINKEIDEIQEQEDIERATGFNDEQ